MIVTARDARTVIVDALDAYIRDRVDALERQIRADQAATGPEGEAELDVPPAADAEWTRITVEEILVMERARLESWREDLLGVFDSRA
jgi:hypothetical protein